MNKTETTTARLLVGVSLVLELCGSLHSEQTALVFLPVASLQCERVFSQTNKKDGQRNKATMAEWWKRGCISLEIHFSLTWRPCCKRGARGGGTEGGGGGGRGEAAEVVLSLMCQWQDVAEEMVSNTHTERHSDREVWPGSPGDRAPGGTNQNHKGGKRRVPSWINAFWAHGYSVQYT